MLSTCRQRLSVLVVVPVLALGLLATACGAGDSASSTASAAEPVVPIEAGSTGDEPAPVPVGAEAEAEAPVSETTPIPIDEVGSAPVDRPVELPREIVVDAPGLEIEEIDGIGQVAEPTTGEIDLPEWLEGLLFAHGLVGTIGTDYGRNLAHLDAHLNDDVLYWYVLLEQDTWLDVELEGLTLEIPRRWDFPGGNSVVVIDPVSGYVYAGGPCPGLALPVNVGIDITDYEAGCGIGFVLDGSIPVDFDLASSIHDEFADVRPQLVVDGEFPVGIVDVKGSVFVDVDPMGLKAVAAGQFWLGLPGKASSLPLSLPVGEGTLGLDRRGDLATMTEKTWINGYLGDDILAEGALAPVADILAVRGDVDVDGFYHRHLENGLPVWTGESYLDVEAVGQFTAGPWIRIHDTDHNQLEGGFSARLDATGIRGTGEAVATPFSMIDLEGRAAIDFELLYDDLRAGHFELLGTLQVAGVSLVDGQVRIDADGIIVEGRLGVGANFVAVSGAIGPGGIALTGEAGVAIDLTDLDGLAATIAGEQGEDETIDRLEAEIDELAPHARIQSLLDEIEDAYEGIRIREDLIADQEAELDRLRRLWDSYSPLEKLGTSVSHGVKVAAANTAIAGLNVDIGRLRLVIAGADGLVDLFEQFVPDARPVDVERFEALKDLLRELKWQRFWANLRNVIAGVVRGADTLLEAFGLDVRIEAKARFTIGTEFDAAVIASVCGDDWCLAVDSSAVDIRSGQACITVAGTESCATV